MHMHRTSPSLSRLIVLPFVKIRTMTRAWILKTSRTVKALTYLPLFHAKKKVVKFPLRIDKEDHRLWPKPPNAFSIHLSMAVNFLYWNVRGIGNDPTLARIKQLVKLHHISFIAIFEPMIALEKIALLSKRLKFLFSFSNHCSTIWIFAKAAYTCTVLHDTAQHLTIRAHHYLWPTSFLISCLYAKCNSSDRQDLWSDLVNLGSSFINTPWLVLVLRDSLTSATKR